MKISKISASSLRQYVRCPHNYYLHRHSDKEPMQLEDNSQLHTGSIIHEVLEKLRYRPKKSNVTDFLHSVNESYKDYTLSLDEIREYKQILEEWVETRDFYEIVDVEKGFNIQLNDFRLTGFIDVIEKKGEDMYRVTDYKTGKYFRDKSELMESIQLKIYTLAVLEEYGVNNIEVAYDQIRFDKPEYVQYTKKELQEFLKYLKSMYRKIKNDNLHKPTPGFCCSWCDYTRYCDALQEELSLEGIEELSLDELAQRYTMMKARESEIKEQKSQIKEMLEARMDKKNLERFECDDFTVKRMQNTYVKYDPTKVMEYAPADTLNDVLSVKKNELEDLDDDVLAKIEEYAETTYSSPYVRVFEND